MEDNQHKVIASKEELRGMLGVPGELVRNKTIDHLDKHCQHFISMSPMLFLATSDASGGCDVSPRGDVAGFVLVLDEKHLVIPERPGNKRLDTLCNIIDSPGIGLIFIIPGLEETLRINGTARIIKDASVMERLESHAKIPLVGILVTVEECFIHCAKAFKRSRLWDTAFWPPEDSLPKVSAILADHAKTLALTEDQISSALKDSYENRLY